MTDSSIPATMTVTFEITNPGFYNMRIHNLHTNPDVTLDAGFLHEAARAFAEHPEAAMVSGCVSSSSALNRLFVPETSVR